MAIIQMLNDEVLEVKQSGEQIHTAIRQARFGILELTAVDDSGENRIWVSVAAISSFAGEAQERPEPVLDVAG